MSLAERSLEYISPDAICANTRNPRKHSPAQIRAIADSVASFGFNAPILVDRTSRIVAGHGRLQAAKLLGLTSVPVIRLEDLTDAQAQAYMLADNKLTDNSVWDEGLLASHLKELSELNLEFEIEDTGFSTSEIDLRIQSLDDVDGDDDDQINPATGPSVTRLGDLWLLGEHRVICGDALDNSIYEALLGEERASAVFADLPYNLKIGGMVSGLGKVKHDEFVMASGEMSTKEFEDFLAKIFGHLSGYSQQGAVMYACMDFRHMEELMAAANRARLKLLNLCVWVKTNGGMGGFYRSQHELVFVLRNGGDRHRNNIQLGRFGRNRTNVWTYPGASSFSGRGRERRLEFHPTVKPVRLVADAILDCTARGDLIMDCFLGSGTTVLAAERTGRRAVGIELEPKFVDTTIGRWQQLTGQEARNKAGQTFAEVQCQRRSS